MTHDTLLVLPTEALLPPPWALEGGIVRAFNPGLIRFREGWLLAYRVVAEPENARRIALCRLGADFSIVQGSQIPFTDHVTFKEPSALPQQATQWFADPRLYELHDRLFIYWNSGWHEPRNAQFIQEIDPATLLPIGQARELTLWGTRQKLEKNWALFEADGELRAVYSVNPHRVLRAVSNTPVTLDFSDLRPPLAHSGGYAKVHGGMRGGSPPVRRGSEYYSFCHSIEDDASGYRYVACAYTFGAHAPHLPVRVPRRPLDVAIPDEARRTHPKLNPAVGDVVYPSGAAFHEGRWVISFGIDDEKCAIALLSEDAVERTLEPTHLAPG